MRGILYNPSAPRSVPADTMHSRRFDNATIEQSALAHSAEAILIGEGDVIVIIRESRARIPLNCTVRTPRRNQVVVFDGRSTILDLGAFPGFQN